MEGEELFISFLFSLYKYLNFMAFLYILGKVLDVSLHEI